MHDYFPLEKYWKLYQQKFQLELTAAECKVKSEKTESLVLLQKAINKVCVRMNLTIKSYLYSDNEEEKMAAKYVSKIISMSQKAYRSYNSKSKGLLSRMIIQLCNEPYRTYIEMINLQQEIDLLEKLLKQMKEVYLKRAVDIYKRKQLGHLTDIRREVDKAYVQLMEASYSILHGFILLGTNNEIVTKLTDLHIMIATYCKKEESKYKRRMKKVRMRKQELKGNRQPEDNETVDPDSGDQPPDER